MTRAPSRTPVGDPVVAASAWTALALVVWAATTLGCASPLGGLDLQEVSPVPIVFVYWDPESARRRLEIMDEARSGNRGAQPSKLGVATTEGIAALFGADATSEASLRRFPGRVSLLDPRTGEVTPFPGTPANARPLAWSADHRRLLFTSAHLGGAFQLYEYDLDARELRTLSRGDRMHLEGDYGPGDMLVMSWLEQSGGRSAAGLTLADRHGTPLRPLVTGVYASSPRLSPLGGEAMYVEAANQDARTIASRDRSQILLQPLDGGDATRLARGREPTYTPDGSTVIYTAETSHGWRLHRIRVDGKGRALLGPSIREERNPSVSPDGRHVVYVSAADDGIERLYIRRIDGTGDRVLLGEGGAAWPVW